MSQANDLTRDWPRESDNEELTQLAGELSAAVPGLSAEALARVERRLIAELNAGERRHRWRRVAFGWTIAASMLLAVSGYVFIRMGSAHPAPAPVAQRERVEDHVTIAVGITRPLERQDVPLVRLDEYRSLFSD